MEEEKRKKRMKWLAYITAFVIFQTLVIVVFVLVVMRVRTPKFRVGDVRINNLTAPSNTTSLDLSITAPIRVKNKNFGPFKYGASKVNFTLDGVSVGEVDIPKGTANFMSTKKFDVTASLKSSQLSPGSGNLMLNSVGELSGKVKIMLIFKKKKTIKMNCTIAIDANQKTLQSVQCK